MLSIAIDINNNENEKEGMGSLAIITLLLKQCILHRNKINNLEYLISNLQKQIESVRLDKQKINE
jgi:hypothetical protein